MEDDPHQILEGILPRLLCHPRAGRLSLYPLRVRQGVSRPAEAIDDSMMRSCWYEYFGAGFDSTFICTAGRRYICGEETGSSRVSRASAVATHQAAFRPSRERFASHLVNN